jgi:hypothetical protein
LGVGRWGGVGVVFSHGDVLLYYINVYHKLKECDFAHGEFVVNDVK